MCRNTSTERPSVQIISKHSTQPLTYICLPISHTIQYISISTMYLELKECSFTTTESEECWKRCGGVECVQQSSTGLTNVVHTPRTRTPRRYERQLASPCSSSGHSTSPRCAVQARPCSDSILNGRTVELAADCCKFDHSG